MGKYDIPGDEKPTSGGGGGTQGGTLPKDRVVRSMAQFQHLIPDYEGRTMAEIIASPLFNGKDAYIFDPAFFQELQGIMLELEKGYGVTPSQQPAGVLGGKTNLKQALSGGGAGGGGGGGGGGSATPYGFNAPDPAQAAALSLNYWEAQVAAGNIPRQQALEQFQADMEAYQSNLDRAEAINADIREREIAESQRRIQQQNIATDRAGIVARDILPAMMPGNAASMNLPLLGNLMGNQVNVPQMFSQGLPDLADLPAIAPQGPEAFPGAINAPILPQFTPPALPDLQGYINQVAQGTGPMGWA